MTGQKRQFEGYDDRAQKHPRREYPPPSHHRRTPSNLNPSASSWAPTPPPTLPDLDMKSPATAQFPGIPQYPLGPPRTLFTHTSAYPPPLPPLAPHLQTAPFTHSSSADTRSGKLNYERLEFFGDACLEMIATRLIFSRFPQLPVGRQSLLREKLVRNSTLAQYARLYGFQQRLVGTGMAGMTGKAEEKMMGDLVEAYIGALVLGGSPVPLEAGQTGMGSRDGFETVSFPRCFGAGDRCFPTKNLAVGADNSQAEEWLTALWVPTLMEEDPHVKVVENRKDELARAIGGKMVKIEYLEVKPMELSRDRSVQQYTIGVYVTGWGYTQKKLGEAVGISKKEAGMKAAADALDHCEIMGQLMVCFQIFPVPLRPASAERRAKTRKLRLTWVFTGDEEEAR